MTLEVLTSYTWPTGPVALATLSVRVDDLAAQLRVPVQTWYEEGLGPARGFGGRLSSGYVVLLEELELAIKHHAARGPGVYVDASVLGSAEPAALVTELLEALGLSSSDLASVADAAAQQFAAELTRRARKTIAAQSPNEEKRGHC